MIYNLAASPDGSIVITGEGGWNGGTNADTLRVSSASGIEFGTGAPIGYVYVVAVSPDERWTVASGFYGDILVYETAGLELYATQATGKKRTKSLAFSPDGGLLASSAKGGTIQLWSFPQDDCAAGSCELTLVLSLSHAGSWDVPLAFAPDSTAAETRFVSSSDSGTISVWSVEGLAGGSPSVSVLSLDSDAVRSLARSPDASMIVAGGDGELLVYDADTLEVLAEGLNGHSGRVNSVAFSPDSARIASGGDDGTLNLWRSPRPTRPRGCGLGPELAFLIAPLGWLKRRSRRCRLARLRPVRNETAGIH
jgi:WD40 repeat protein